MKDNRGVLTIAHTKPKYAWQAVNLARSIRLRAPDLPLAVATDLDPAAFKGAFEHVIPWDFSRWPGVLCKLEAYGMTPFETTLFVETDCLAVRSLHVVFDYFDGQQFAVFGRNEPTTSYFRSLELVRALIPSPTYPVFNGGLLYFRRSPLAEEIFRRAKELSRLYDCLHLARVRGGMESDEPLIGLAMAKAGLRATDDRRLDIMFAPERPLFHIDIDVLAGECSFVRLGRVVRRR